MPDSLVDTFKNIKVGVLGTKTHEIDKEIDSSLRAIGTYSSKVSTNKYIETMKDLIGTIGVQDPDLMLKSFQSNQRIETYDQSGRIPRYQEYDAILSKISYCQRALKVLADNIISPDDITKRSINFVIDELNKDEESKTKITISRLKMIEKDIQLEKNINKIVTSVLKKGDYFVEILYAPQGENALTILNESLKIDKMTDEDQRQEEIRKYLKSDWKPLSDPYEWSGTYDYVTESGDRESINKKGRVVIEFGDFGGGLAGITPSYQGLNFPRGQWPPKTQMPNTMMEPVSKDAHKTKGLNDDKLPDPEDQFKSKFDKPDGKKDSENGVDLKDIFISFHNPKYVIRLETERFRTCLGYLVFPKVDPMSLTMVGNGNLAGDTINAVCTNIIYQIHQALISDDRDSIRISDDLREAILQYLKVIKNNEDLKIRYVPPEMMVHWRINVDRFDPYGESIFECVYYDSKLLIALKTAATIKRLTSSTDKRFINIETGLPRDAKNLIDMIRESMRKRKISIDSMGSIDTIPSQIVTFEDIYIPMRDGKKFVEFDHAQFGQNPQEDVEGLKFIRDNIVANLGVPAPFLGLEENTSNRALLSVENINFCRTIISYQKELSVYLRDLFEKIYKLIWPRDITSMDDIRITFPEPKISPYEHEMEYVEHMQRLIEAYQALGVPKNLLKKKYLPSIDWETVDTAVAEEKINTELGEGPSGEGDNALGGAAGGYGGGSMGGGF